MKAVPILEVAPLVTDRVEPFDGTRLYLATGGLDEDSSLAPVPVTYEDRPSRADLAVRPGDICFARMQNTEKVLEFDTGQADLILSTGFAVLRPIPDRLYSGFLRHWLYTGEFQSTKDRLCSGATQRAITNEKIEHLKIPLPGLDEQRRIAELLDKVTTVRAKRRAAVAQLNALTQAIFLDMFGDPASNPKGWPRRSISDVATVITGNTPSRAFPEYYGTEIEWIKSDNINTPHYYVTRAEEGLSTLGKQIARVVPAGSTLVTCIAGSPECIGNAAMTDREVAFNQQINALVPRSVNPHFLYVQLLTGKRLVQQASTSAMKGMVSKSRFSRITLMCPPLPIQRQFASCVIAVERLKSVHQTSLAGVDALFASLQHRAFRGEL